VRPSRAEAAAAAPVASAAVAPRAERELYEFHMHLSFLTRARCGYGVSTRSLLAQSVLLAILLLNLHARILLVNILANV